MQTINQVHHDMMGQGWSIIDTTSFLRIEFKESFGDIDWSATENYYVSNDGLPIEDRIYGGFTNYLDFLDSLLKKALPNERLNFNRLEYRIQRKPEKTNVTSWHIDGGYIRFICPLNGDSTLLRMNKRAMSVPLKHTLLMTGAGRFRKVGIKGTVHRRPAFTNDRELLVGNISPQYFVNKYYEFGKDRQHKYEMPTN